MDDRSAGLWDTGKEALYESAKWRWEFLRRNYEFRKDWATFLDLIDQIQNSSECQSFLSSRKIVESKPFARYFHIDKFKSEVIRIRELFDKWDITSFLDPNKSLDEFLEDDDLIMGFWKDRAKIDRKYILSSIVMPHPIEVVTQSSAPDSCLTTQSRLVIAIDFTKVNSFTNLKEEVIFHLQVAFSQYSLFGGIGRGDDEWEPRKKFDKKKYMTDFQVLIMVGDLKDKEGLTNLEIAKKIDPRKFRKNPESAIRTVSHLYKRYKDLVNGGYKDITYP